MKKIFLFLFSFHVLYDAGICQQVKEDVPMILFHGMVSDGFTLTPLSGSHVTINRKLFSISGDDGSFSFYVNKNDTVVFSRVGYKPTQLLISDTLSSKDFLAGVFLHSDTISIGEVIIVPRLANLKNELYNSVPKISTQIENAKYNMSVTSYNGRYFNNHLGDPVSNYSLIRQKQSIYAYEQGGIPSDQMISFNPLMLLPAAYLHFRRVPEPPGPLQMKLTRKEVDQINRKYLESLKLNQK
jgi:hypothetical protein